MMCLQEAYEQRKAGWLLNQGEAGKVPNLTAALLVPELGIRCWFLCGVLFLVVILLCHGLNSREGYLRELEKNLT